MCFGAQPMDNTIAKLPILCAHTVHSKNVFSGILSNQYRGTVPESCHYCEFLVNGDSGRLSNVVNVVYENRDNCGYCPANVRRRYTVSPSPIDQAHTKYGPCENFLVSLDGGKSITLPFGTCNRDRHTSPHPRWGCTTLVWRHSWPRDSGQSNTNLKRKRYRLVDAKQV